MNANEKVLPPITPKTPMDIQDTPMKNEESYSNMEMMKAELKACEVRCDGLEKALNEMFVAVGIGVPSGYDILAHSAAYCKDVVTQSPPMNNEQLQRRLIALEESEKTINSMLNESVEIARAYKKAHNEMLVALGIVVPADDDPLKYSDAYCKDVAMKKGLHANILAIVEDKEKADSVYQMLARQYINQQAQPEEPKETEGNRRVVS